MKIKKNQIEYVAELAKLKFSQNDIKTFTIQINDILNYINILNNVQTDKISEICIISINNQKLREDIVKPSLGSKQALANASKVKDTFFQVPKIIE